MLHMFPSSVVFGKGTCDVAIAQYGPIHSEFMPSSWGVFFLGLCISFAASACEDRRLKIFSKNMAWVRQRNSGLTWLDGVDPSVQIDRE